MIHRTIRAVVFGHRTRKDYDVSLRAPGVVKVGFSGGEGELWRGQERCGVVRSNERSLDFMSKDIYHT